MLQVHAAGYDLGKNDITYKFSVKLANQEWEVHKVYKDFQKLDSDLASKYGKPALPQLTGTIFLRVLSDATGQKRLPKLEDYITQILSSWKAAFKNPKYFEIPNPKGSRFPNILIEITMAQFLMIGENYEAYVEDEEEEAEEEAEGDDDDAGNDDDDNQQQEGNDDEATSLQGRSETAVFQETPKRQKQQQTTTAAPAAAATTSLAWSDDEDAEPVVNTSAGNSKSNMIAAEPVATRKASNESAVTPRRTSLTTTTTTNPQTQTPRTKLNAAKLANIQSQQTAKGSALANALTKKEIKKLGDDFDIVGEDEDKDDFDLVDEKKDTFEAAHVLTQCRTMTGEIDIFVKDYIIHPSAYIEYNFHVTFCGFGWTVTKRFSQFASFYENLMDQLKGTQHVDYVPPMDDVAFPAWRKCDPDVAETRSVWLTNFFKILAPMMDEWFTIGNLTHFKIRRRAGEEEDELDRYASHSWIKVAVNRLLFEWFNFANYIQEFSALDAEKVAKENEKLLPQFMQKNLENVRKEEERVQREKNIAYRNSFMEKLSDNEFQDLVRILSSFDDDRHCLALLEFFAKTGYYYPGKTRVERIQELDAQKAIQEKRRKEAAALRGEPIATGGTPIKSQNNLHHQQQHGRTNSASNNNTDQTNNNNNNIVDEQHNNNTHSAASKWARRRFQSMSPASASVSLNNFHNQQQQQNSADSYTASSTNFNHNNNNNNNTYNTTALPSSSTTATGGFTRNIDQSMYFRSGGKDDQDEKDNVNMDIFDRMQNSALFGANTSTKDFTSLVTSAVNAAKDQLRGRTRTNTIVKGNDNNKNNNNNNDYDYDDNNDDQKNRRNNTTGGGKYDKTKLSRQCGLSSVQIAKVAEAIPFNDTREAAITILSPLLMDMDNLNAIYETLIYDWEATEETLIELLTKKEAPEKFKFTPSAPPSIPT